MAAAHPNSHSGIGRSVRPTMPWASRLMQRSSASAGLDHQPRDQRLAPGVLGRVALDLEHALDVGLEAEARGLARAPRRGRGRSRARGSRPGRRSSPPAAPCSPLSTSIRCTPPSGVPPRSTISSGRRRRAPTRRWPSAGPSGSVGVGSCACVVAGSSACSLSSPGLMTTKATTATSGGQRDQPQSRPVGHAFPPARRARGPVAARWASAEERAGGARPARWSASAPARGPDDARGSPGAELRVRGAAGGARAAPDGPPTPHAARAPLEPEGGHSAPAASASGYATQPPAPATAARPSARSEPRHALQQLLGREDRGDRERGEQPRGGEAQAGLGRPAGRARARATTASSCARGPGQRRAPRPDPPGAGTRGRRARPPRHARRSGSGPGGPHSEAAAMAAAVRSLDTARSMAMAQAAAATIARDAAAGC